MATKKLTNIARTSAEHAVQYLSRAGASSNGDAELIAAHVSGGHSYESTVFQASYCGLLASVYLTELGIGDIELATIKRSIVEYWGSFAFKNKIHPILENLLFSLAEMEAFKEADYKSCV